MGKYTYVEGRRVLTSELQQQQSNAGSIPTAPISSLDLEDEHSDLSQAQMAYDEGIKKGVIRPEKIPKPDTSKNLNLALAKLDEDKAYTRMYHPSSITKSQKASTSKEYTHSDLIGKLLQKMRPMPESSTV